MEQQQHRSRAIYFPTKPEEAKVMKFSSNLLKKDDDELISAYNSAARLGMVGSIAQCQYTLGLAIALRKRFGDPVVHYDKGALFCSCIIERNEAGQLIKTKFSNAPVATKQKGGAA